MRTTLLVLLLSSIACSSSAPTSNNAPDDPSAASRASSPSNATATASSASSAAGGATAAPGAPPSDCVAIADDDVVRVLEIDDTFINSHNVTEILGPVFYGSESHASVTKHDACLQRFSTGQRLMYSLVAYRDEILNGGHRQFYSNSTGIFWPAALAALEAIDAREGADILRTANQRMGGDPPRERQPRLEKLRSLSPKFDDLDRRFFSFQYELDDKMLEYVRKRPEQFRFSGKVRVPRDIAELEERIEKMFREKRGR
jgi:hypothetical protein